MSGRSGPRTSREGIRGHFFPQTSKPARGRPKARPPPKGSGRPKKAWGKAAPPKKKKNSTGKSELPAIPRPRQSFTSGPKSEIKMIAAIKGWPRKRDAGVAMVSQIAALPLKTHGLKKEKKTNIMSRDIPISWITSAVGWGDSIQQPPFHPKVQLCARAHSHTRQYLMGRTQKHSPPPEIFFCLV